MLAPLLAAALFPAQIRPEPAVAIPQQDKTAHVWHTRVFRIESDQPLDRPDLETLARVADTTAKAVEAFPLPLFHPPRDERPRILLLDDQEAYRQSGANPDTAGTYHGRKRVVLVNRRYLFRETSNVRRTPAPDEDLVVHELVHLCMHRVQPQLPQWLCEGIAEYFAVAHRGGGRFDFRHLETEIAPTILHRLGAEDRRATLVAIADLANLDARAWVRQQNRMEPTTRYQAYATSLLLIHYYLHGSDERRAEIKAALALRDRPHRHPVRFEDLVENADSIQDSLTRYWRTRGLDLAFAPPGNPDPDE